MTKAEILNVIVNSLSDEYYTTFADYGQILYIGKDGSHYNIKVTVSLNNRTIDASPDIVFIKFYERIDRQFTHKDTIIARIYPDNSLSFIKNLKE